MSETKTLYTMYQIKEAVKNLGYATIGEFDEKVKIEFEKCIEDNAEMRLELKKWENYCNELIALEKKYESSSTCYYGRHVDTGKLKYYMSECFKDRFKEERKKIVDQFEVILNRLASMRKPDAALEFLKLCGIELPEKVKQSIDIPVDPEFIKSVLPKQKMLTETNTENLGDEE